MDGVIRGGFQATVLDLVLGLVTISVMDDPTATMAATTDLTVRYFQPVLASTGCLNVIGTLVHQQGKQIAAEAFLEDSSGVRVGLTPRPSSWYKPAYMSIFSFAFAHHHHGPPRSRAMIV